VTIPIIGNGDIRTSHDAEKHFTEIPGLSGIMIGRGAIGNPWIFQAIRHYLATGNEIPAPSIRERIDLLKEHFLLSVEKRGEGLGLIVMRKHFSGYLKGLYEATKIRSQLMQTHTLLETLDILDNYLFKLENLQ
jgi:tRNA-dihydrouridine synthase B